MPDDLERQLEAFGRTLERRAGEPITGRSHGSGGESSPRGRRRPWALVGAAACVVAAVAGLMLVVRDDPGAPASQMPVADTSPSSTPPPTTGPAPDASSPESVPADPLGLERDGWMLVQRIDEPFEAPPDIECPAASALATLDSAPQIHDIVTPPDSASPLDVDIQVISVGSLDRGTELADAVLEFGACIEAEQGVSVDTSALSAIRASWFRVGPSFALVTVVGEGDRSIVIEIEGGEFDDDLIAELAHRADEFLRTGQPASQSGSDGAPATTIMVEDSGR